MGKRANTQLGLSEPIQELTVKSLVHTCQDWAPASRSPLKHPPVLAEMQATANGPLLPLADKQLNT